MRTVSETKTNRKQIVGGEAEASTEICSCEGADGL
jgi:hypothetical protein